LTWTLLSGLAAPVVNGDSALTTEDPWDQKEEEPTREEPGGEDQEPSMATTEETAAPEMMEEEEEEEEETPAPKGPAPQTHAPKKEHINVVFIGHVGQWRGEERGAQCILSVHKERGERSSVYPKRP